MAQRKTLNRKSVVVRPTIGTGVVGAALGKRNKKPSVGTSAPKLRVKKTKLPGNPGTTRTDVVNKTPQIGKFNKIALPTPPKPKAGPKPKRGPKTSGPVGGAVQKARTPKPAAAGRQSAAPPSTGSGAGGSAPATHGGAPATTGSQTGGSGKTTSGGRTSTAPVAGASGTASASSDISAMFAPARRELDRQRASLDAVKQAEIDDWNAYNTWLETKQTAAEKALTDGQAAIRAEAQQRNAEAASRIQGFVDGARRLVGGNIPEDVAQQSGLNAVATAQGYQTAADAARNAYFGNQQLTGSQQLFDQREVNKARAANVFAGIGANYHGGLNKLASAGSDLETKIAEATLNDRYKQQQFALDQQAADFLNGIKEGELQVKQYNAQTERIKVKLNAKEKQALLKLKQQTADADLTWKQFNAKMARQKFGLERRKQMWREYSDRKSGFGASSGSTGQGAKLRQETTKYMQKWYTDTLKTLQKDNIGTGTEARNFARQAVAAIAGMGKGMRAETVDDILTGILGGVVKDPAIQQLIAQHPAFT